MPSIENVFYDFNCYQCFGKKYILLFDARAHFQHLCVCVCVFVLFLVNRFKSYIGIRLQQSENLFKMFKCIGHLLFFFLHIQQVRCSSFLPKYDTKTEITGVTVNSIQILAI